MSGQPRCRRRKGAPNLILSNFNSTTGEWLQEVKDICDYVVTVADKFIERRERQRNVWDVLYPYEQFVMEMNLMEQMEMEGK